eukprot:gene7337-11405_t
MLCQLLILITQSADAQVAGRVVLEPEYAGVAPPADWLDVGRVQPGDIMDLVVVMKKSPEVLDKLEQTLWEVSDPHGPMYGKHLTRDQVKTLVNPDGSDSDKAVADVAEWLAGSTNVRTNTGTKVKASYDKDTLTVSIDAVVAEELFETEIRRYSHATLLHTTTIFRTRGRNASATAAAATAPYTVPSSIAEVVAMVGNLAHFPALPIPLQSPHPDNNAAAAAAAAARAAAQHSTQTKNPDWPSDCGKMCAGVLESHVTPAVLQMAYKLGHRPNGTSAKGSIAVAEFTQVFWDQEDLDLFGSQCMLGNITVDHMVGMNNPRPCDISGIIKPNLCREALLDIETIKSVSGTIPLTNYYNKEYSILSWAEQLGNLTDDDLPLVHSVSYGNDEKQQTSTAYMLAVNVAIQKLGVRGRTVLFASGDGGVAGRSCNIKRYCAGFPASSPYVTSVGGTDFVVRSEIGPEAAWLGSGGGFSDVFPIPPYQAAAVAAYKAKAGSNLPPASRWNNTGRGFPDVSALGGQKNQYCITLGDRKAGVATTAYGTSAATPVVAGVVAKLNEIRLAAGKPPMGFLNPFIYAHPEGWNDVTVGASGFNTSPENGFVAIAGWDAATGYGSPNFEVLSALVQSI